MTDKIKDAAKKAGTGTMGGMAAKGAKVMNAAMSKKAKPDERGGRKTGGGYKNGGMVKGKHK